MLWGWLKRRQTASSAPVDASDQHPFQHTLDIEVKSWCYGLQNLNEPIEPRVVQCVIRSLMQVLDAAIRKQCPFDICAISDAISTASKGALSVREVAFYILARLPHPQQLNPDERGFVGELIRGVESTFPGAVERCCERWNLHAPNHRAPALHLPPVPEHAK